MGKRLLALGLLAVGVAAVFGSLRRGEAAQDASQNGRSRPQAAQLRRELERS